MQAGLNDRIRQIYGNANNVIALTGKAIADSNRDDLMRASAEVVNRSLHISQQGDRLYYTRDFR